MSCQRVCYLELRWYEVPFPRWGLVKSLKRWKENIYAPQWLFVFSIYSFHFQLVTLHVCSDVSPGINDIRSITPMLSNFVSFFFFLASTIYLCDMLLNAGCFQFNWGPTFSAGFSSLLIGWWGHAVGVSFYKIFSHSLFVSLVFVWGVSNLRSNTGLLCRGEMPNHPGILFF